MKKILLKLALLGFVTFCLLYTYDKIALIVARDQVKSLMENFKLLPHARYVSFGNSQGKRLKLGYPVKNDFVDFCLNGNDIHSIEQQIKIVAPLLKHDQIILVNISVYSLKYYDTLDERMSDQVRSFYYSMPMSYVSWNDLEGFIKCRFYEINNMSNFKELISKLMAGKSIVDKPREIDTAKETARILEYMKTHKEEREAGAQSSLNLIHEGTKFYPDIDQKVDGVLKNIKKIAVDNHLQLIFYSTPCLAEMRQKFGIELCDSLNTFAKKVLMQNGITYFEHFYDQEFINRLDYFDNGNHLNKKGSTVFVPKLLKEIQAVQ